MIDCLHFLILVLLLADTPVLLPFYSSETVFVHILLRFSLNLFLQKRKKPSCQQWNWLLLTHSLSLSGSSSFSSWCTSPLEYLCKCCVNSTAINPSTPALKSSRGRTRRRRRERKPSECCPKIMEHHLASHLHSVLPPVLSSPPPSQARDEVLVVGGASDSTNWSTEVLSRNRSVAK